MTAGGRQIKLRPGLKDWLGSADKTNVSALWRRYSGAEGTGGARTTQTYILGVGASGALLAGAGVALISLVGLVSFEMWPGSPTQMGSQEEAQLNIGGAANQPQGQNSLGHAVGVLTAPGVTGRAPAPSGGGNPKGEKSPPKAEGPAQTPPSTAPTAPAAPAPAPVDTGNRSGDQGSSGNVKTPAAQNTPSSGGADVSKPPKRVPPGHSKGTGSAGKGNSGNGSSGKGAAKVKPPKTQSQPVPIAPGNSGSNGSGKSSPYG